MFVYNEGISHNVVYNVNEYHIVLLSIRMEVQKHYSLPVDVMVVAGFKEINTL